MSLLDNSPQRQLILAPRFVFAISYARRARNPEIRAARKKWLAMRARIIPAGTLEDPQIGVQVMYAPCP